MEAWNANASTFKLKLIPEERQKLADASRSLISVCVRVVEDMLLGRLFSQTARG
jgi:hypothetical protein